jgi:hypothetical protein
VLSDPLAALLSGPGGLCSLALGINSAKGLALVFFFGFFLVLLLRLVLGSKDSFARRAEIPLHDHQVVEPREMNRHD